MTLLNFGNDTWVSMDHPHQLGFPTIEQGCNMDATTPRSNGVPLTKPPPSTIVRNFLGPTDNGSSDFDLETDDGHSSEGSHADTASEIASIVRTWEVSQILDPTSIEAGFDFACLDCLEYGSIQDPLEAFKEVCWSESTSKEATRLDDPTFFPYQISPHIPAFPSVMTLETLPEHDDAMCNSMTNETFWKKRPMDLFTRARHRSRAASEPTIHSSSHFYNPPSSNAPESDGIGFSPSQRSTPQLPRHTLSKRFVSFCSSLPSKFNTSWP